MPDTMEAPPGTSSSGSATVTEVNIVEAPPPAPPKTPPGEIHLDKGPQPTVRKGSAMERLQDELAKKAKPQFFESPPEPAQETQSQPPVSEKTGTSPEGESPPTEKTGDTQTPPSTPGEKKGEKNPWKLVDTYKSEAAKAKARIAELEKAVPEMSKLTEYHKQLEEQRKRNDELEKEIRYHNYQKSAEWQEKYEKPFNAVWARAADEIAQINATDRSGQTRPGTVQDLLEISNLPLGEAQSLAEERFGSLANYVMGYRSKILEMHQQRQQALKDAKEASITRDKEFEARQQQVNGELTKHIKETWEKANSEMLEDKSYGHLFKEVDGDQDGNQRLAKGLELVNRAFSENPNDPNLTPEQRAAVVRRHAAVRMRAAAFGRLNARFVKLQGEHDKLKKQLDGYKQSTPSTGGTVTTTPPAANGKGIDRVFSDLAKIAK